MRMLSRSRWKPCAGICVDGDGGQECPQGRKQRWGWEEGPRELIPTGWSVSKDNCPQGNCWLENLPAADPQTSVTWVPLVFSSREVRCLPSLKSITFNLVGAKTHFGSSQIQRTDGPVTSVLRLLLLLTLQQWS